MKRRQLLATGSGLIGTLFLSRVFAQEAPPETPPAPPVVKKAVDVQIARNHGHALLLDRSELFTGLTRQYQIQGQSGHPHIIELNTSHDLQLASVGIIQIESSVDAGHSHLVTIMLKEFCGN